MRDGQPVAITDELRSLGIPLMPTVAATAAPLRRLSERRRHALIEAGYLDRQVHRDGTIADVPLWTLKSRFWRRQAFPAGREVAVHQSYTPSLGGQPSLSFGSPDLDPGQMARYADRFCTDPAFARSAQALYRRASADGSPSFQASEQYLTYVMPAGSGPIGTFTLIVDKGDPATMVSFCGSALKRTGPTTSEMVVKDYVPDRAIDVLFLKSAPASQPYRRSEGDRGAVIGAASTTLSKIARRRQDRGWPSVPDTPCGPVARRRAAHADWRSADVAPKRRISCAIRSSGRTFIAAPRSIASLGMPKTTQLSSSCATVTAPARRISRRPVAPSSPMPVIRMPSAFAPAQRAAARNSTSTDGRCRETKGPSFTDTL